MKTCFTFALPFLLLLLLATLPCSARERLNIVLLCTDDQRHDTLGCTGNKIIQTPHIDALARQGRVYDNSFVTTSICAISRASLFTGQYARRHGIHDFATPLSAEQFAASYVGQLKKAGYRVGFIGKWGVGAKMPEAEFDYWRGFPGQGRYFTRGDEEHLNRKMSRQALEFLDGCDGQQAFCLQVSFKAAHAQDGEKWEFPTEAPLRERYRDVVIPPPPTATEKHFAALPKMLQTSEARKRWQPRFKNEELYQATVKDYYRLITGVDNVVGEIVAKLEERALFERTLIVFTSDNGFYLGDFGLADKWFMHEPSIRVPLVIYDPRLPADARGRHIDEWALNIDIAPTILGAAGLPPVREMQGLDLLAEGHARRRAERRAFYYEHPFRHALIPQAEGVREARWKYTRYQQKEESVEQLFDLEHDPLEERDLAALPQQRDELQRLRKRLVQLQTQAK